MRSLFERLKDNDVKGIIIILDEINGIASNPEFAHFIKSLVDDNALNRNPIPLMLLTCGVKERLGEMIQNHQPIERIFDIIEICPMTKEEMRDFFLKSFSSVDIKVNDDALDLLCHYSAGFPKIMHIIGDATFWIDKDNIIDANDASTGILLAADEVGKKFFDQQVLKALRSKDYHIILTKLGKSQFDLSFIKADIEKGLTESEKKKFNNFLQRMKKLKVLSSGEERGEYIFNSRLVRLYVLLKSLEKPIE